MYCPNCGNQNDDNNKFCWKCGEYLENEETPEPPKKKRMLGFE